MYLLRFLLSFSWTVWIFSAPYINLAIKQPAFQESTTAVDKVASLAVDGSARATILLDFTCSETIGETSRPWWTVDLGGSYPITAVSILNRLDCCGRNNKWMTALILLAYNSYLLFSLMVSPGWPFTHRWLDAYPSRRFFRRILMFLSPCIPTNVPHSMFLSECVSQHISVVLLHVSLFRCLSICLSRCLLRFLPHCVFPSMSPFIQYFSTLISLPPSNARVHQWLPLAMYMYLSDIHQGHLTLSLCQFWMETDVVHIWEQFTCDNLVINNQ